MSYYCHSCQDAKHQNKIEHCADGLICKDCRSDFLEELTEQHFPSLVYEQSAASRTRSRHPFGYSLFSSSGGGGASGNSDGLAVASGGASSSSGSSSGGGGGEVLRLRLSRRGAGGGGGSSSFGSGASASAAASASSNSLANHGELDQLIQSLFQQVFGIVGDLDDYAMGVESLDNVVTQLMNQLDGGGPPPATSDDLRKIQSVPVTEQQQADQLQCSVCFDEFLVGCYVDRLPCQHFFHHDCILPWLEKHGTCPVCRKRLSGEDTTTQTFVDRPVSTATTATASASAATATAASSSSSRQSATNQQRRYRLSLQHQPRFTRRRRVLDAATATATASSPTRRDRNGEPSGANESHEPMDED